MFVDLYQGILEEFAEASRKNRRTEHLKSVGLCLRKDKRALPRRTLCQMCWLRPVHPCNPRKCAECLNKAIADGCTPRRKAA